MSTVRSPAKPRCRAALLQRSAPARQRPRAPWPRLLALSATLMVALALAIAAPQLAGVERLAETTRAEVIPRMVVQHKQAVWTESLRSAADLVVHTPDGAVRKDALIKAEQLARALLHGTDGERRAVLTQAIGGIRLAAAAADTADRLDREGRAMLTAAEGRIEEIRTALRSIGKDPAGMPLQRPGRTTAPARDPDTSRRHPETALPPATGSGSLLARLDEGRILLATAASMEERDGLRAAAERFGAIGQQLQAGLGALRPSPGEAHLADMLEGFIALSAVFEHRQAALAAHDQALAAGRVTKMQLAHLRETLAADAAGAAEASVATIADHVRGMRNVALATLGAGVAVAAGITLYGQRATPALRGRAGDEPARPREGWRQAHLARSAELTRRYHHAQRNLDHWRDSLPGKLQQTIAAVLTGSSPDHEEPEMEAPFAAVSEVQASAPGDGAPLPDPAPELIEGIGDQLVSLAGSAADAGMAAVGDCIAAASGKPAAPQPGGDDDEPEAALLRLEVVTGTVEQVVIRIGLCLGDINALAGTPDLVAATAATFPDVEPIVHRLQGLFEDLVIAREHVEVPGRASA